MKKSLFSLFALLLLGACSFVVNRNSEAIEIQELDYGIGKAELISTWKNEKSPTGKIRTTGEEFKIIKRTSEIPLAIGSQFGVNYVVRSSSLSQLNLTFRWTYPKTIVNNQGKKFSQVEFDLVKPTDAYTYSTYTIEEDYEMVEGEWTFSILKGKELIYERKFNLVKSATHKKYGDGKKP